jgi:hypothetical protein
MGIKLMQYVISTNGILKNAWVVPGLAFVVVLAMIYARFIIHLPSAIRTLVIIAGVIYVTGAIFLESLSGLCADVYTESGIEYQLVITLEEFLEMLGLVLLIYALLLFREADLKEGQIRYDVNPRMAAKDKGVI